MSLHDGQGCNLDVVDLLIGPPTPVIPMDFAGFKLAMEKEFNDHQSLALEVSRRFEIVLAHVEQTIPADTPADAAARMAAAAIAHRYYLALAETPHRYFVDIVDYGHAKKLILHEVALARSENFAHDENGALVSENNHFFSKERGRTTSSDHLVYKIIGRWELPDYFKAKDDPYHERYFVEGGSFFEDTPFLEVVAARMSEEVGGRGSVAAKDLEVVQVGVLET